MTIFFKKIIFLIKSNANVEIIYFFILTKIKNIFYKYFIKKFKKDNILFLKSKIITNDYFSPHAYHFYSILKNLPLRNILEIGSFEGNSSMFLARHFKETNIYCIDNWEGTEEYKGLNFNTLEKNFDENVKEFKNIIKIKTKSDSFYKDNQIFFDLIYVDGYHKAHQVLNDFKNSWKSLNNNGIIIFDDYMWEFFKDIKDNPCFAINSYLKQIKNKYKILKITNSQLFIKKIG